MDRSAFWRLFEDTATPAALRERLADLPDEELADFERHHDALTDQAYDWGLWGAAYLIGGGCSDDCFSDFRAYLLSHGRAVFERALTDPDSLADADVADPDAWEDWASPTQSVMHARTGEYGFFGQREGAAPADPAGDEWEDEDLSVRFPRLAAAHGG